MVYWTQVSRHGTGSFIPSGTQMPTEGTGLKTPTTEDKQMTTVTYRGVKYDAEEYNAKVVDEATKRERHDLIYRGLKVKSKASPCS